MEQPSKSEVRAALRASLIEIETAAHAAIQAIDSEQKDIVLARCIDGVDNGFIDFDFARIAVNQQQIDALEGWERLVYRNSEEQNDENVIQQWLKEKRDENKP